MVCNLSKASALLRPFYFATKHTQSLTHKLSGKLTILLLILVVICFSGLPAQGMYGGGSGTAQDPYLIYTAEQMNTIGANSADWDKHFKLMADIDLSSFKEEGFNIIGTSLANPFTGVFDGNGKKILNFTRTCTDTDYIGLFGYVHTKNAEIKDLGLIDPNVDAATGDKVGSLAGILRGGKITNCYIQGGSVSGDRCVGGLVGSNDGRITNCYVITDVLGDDDVGGLGGENSEKITNCSVLANVSGHKDDVGGLVGKNWSTITKCTSSGMVSGRRRVGGLVGHSSGKIVNCYSSSNVSGSSSVGGLVGINGDPYDDEGCLCTAGAIFNCYSIGSVTGKTDVGGLVGTNRHGPVMYCFWDTQASGRNDMCGYLEAYGTGCNSANGKVTTEMQMTGTFTSAGWDFVGESINGTEDIWCICEGMDYPKLTWQFVIGDFDGDADVDLVDFAVFAARWLQTDSSFWCGDGGTDLANDGNVDFNDLKQFAENWLSGTQ